MRRISWPYYQLHRFICTASELYQGYTQSEGRGSRYSDCIRAGRSGDRIPVGARFSAPVQTGPEAHPASCTMGTGSFLGVRCGRGVTLTPQPPSSAEVKNRVELYLCSKGLCGLWKGETYLYWVWNLTKFLLLESLLNNGIMPWIRLHTRHFLLANFGYSLSLTAFWYSGNVKQWEILFAP